MILPDEIVIGAMISIGTFVAWFIKSQISEFKSTIDRNTTALVNIQLVLEKCKFVQEIKDQ